jgi:hypothetical protein
MAAKEPADFHQPQVQNAADIFLVESGEEEAWVSSLLMFNSLCVQ